MSENKPDAENTDIKLQCRTCKKTIYWNDDYPFRPFCSERCQLIDLGEWASEGHKIPGSAPDFTDDSHS
mgnify:CR=1 FL=1